jgi:hypothetical protein
VPKNTLLSALFVFAFLSALSLGLAADQAAVPAAPAGMDQASASGLDSAHDAGFATWLASHKPTLIPLPETTAQCRTCAECPSTKPFCCITSSSGCASCFARQVNCQEL